MSKSIAWVTSIHNIQNIVDGDVLLDFDIWYFEDGHPGSEVVNDGALPIQFDAAASMTVINDIIVTKVVDRAHELGFNSIGRKDVVLPVLTRG